MRAVNDAVDSGVEAERVDVCKEGVAKIAAESWRPFLVKVVGAAEVFPRRGEDLNPHGISLRSSSLACSQSMN